MAKQVSLKAVQRVGIGRGHARKVRAQRMIPGIVYGSHIQPIPIQVDAREVDRIFKHATSENMLVDLSLDEGSKVRNRLAFIQEIQHHPLSDQVLHLDFHEVRADEKLHARVPIVAIGEPEGVRTSSGILEQALRELEVECLPKDLPEFLEVDVSALQIGGSVHVHQVNIPQGVTVLSHTDVSVFSVLAPAKEEVVAAPTELTEPEVIKQKRPEEVEEGGTKAEGKESKAEGKAGVKPTAKAGEVSKPVAKGQKSEGKGQKSES